MAIIKAKRRGFWRRIDLLEVVLVAAAVALLFSVSSHFPPLI